MKSLQRHWLAVLVCTIAGGLLGFGLWTAMSSSSSSTTVVFVSALDANPYSPDPRGQSLTNMVTEAQLVRSDSVLESAAEDLFGDITPQQLAKFVDVSIPVGSQTLEITCEPDAYVAADECADSLAIAYLANRKQRADDLTAARRSQINEAQAQASKDLAEASKGVAESKAGSAKRLQAEQGVVFASDSLAALASLEAELASWSTSPGEVFSQGGVSGTARPVLLMAFGALAGLLVAAGWGLRRDIAMSHQGADTALDVD